MTPPENADRRETPAEGAAERTTVFSAQDVTGPETNGSGAHEQGTLSPPPWERVAADQHAEWGAGYSAPGAAAAQQPAEEVLYSGQGADVNWSAQTISEERPVVSGSAAAAAFGQESTQQVAAPPGLPGGEVGNQRTSVDLGSTARSGGGQSGTPSALRRPGRGPRRASLQVKRIDPWSVLKLTLVLGTALFFVWMVAVGVLYIVLDGMGVWDNLNGTYSQLVTDDSGAGAESLITAGTVFGVAAIIGAVNIVLLSALATVCSFVYNVSADLAGGLEVTLSERE
ncbi:transmembrane protein DUF3566 [Tamaricihabitans halophyticus]|uniref:Transmembrane protein DUF3566 n=1 Tax=Tamaricihabitans halophyticus TaxID=1262583 RepID=A0A4R2R600_9PSEU|nr:DUF3566 domain-containing protein [Tamaricihabitans halophyticus]TCP57457.1 transmembrane protein DUF3566 [Tamaricihabitans halophyticus]